VFEENAKDDEYDEELHNIRAAIENNQKPESNNGVYELTDENYSTFLSKGRHFVKFYAPWCGHCRNLAPTWVLLGESFQNDHSVSISMLDCDTHSLACQKYKIEGYPTLLWIVDGKVIEKYTGARSHQDLKAFVNRKKQEDIIEIKKYGKVRSEDVMIYLTNHDFERVVKNGVTFVHFWVPWSTHCKALMPTWYELSKKVIGKAKVAALDCSQYDFLCNKYEVDGYPSLIIFKNGVKKAEYEDDRTLIKMVEFVLNYTENTRDEL